MLAGADCFGWLQLCVCGVYSKLVYPNFTLPFDCTVDNQMSLYGAPINVRRTTCPAVCLYADSIRLWVVCSLLHATAPLPSKTPIICPAWHFFSLLTAVVTG
jgi:hypothetical protein